MASPQTLSDPNRRVIARWAAACAERVLPLYKADEAAEETARNALARTRAYSAGSGTAAEEISKRLVVVKIANAATTPAGAAAARAVAQAAAVAHMGAMLWVRLPTRRRQSRSRTQIKRRRSSRRSDGSWHI
nr:hypothetical protein [Arthrobacter zhaoxinii]